MLGVYAKRVTTLSGTEPSFCPLMDATQLFTEYPKPLNSRFFSCPHELAAGRLNPQGSSPDHETLALA